MYLIFRGKAKTYTWVTLVSDNWNCLRNDQRVYDRYVSNGFNELREVYR